jgi:hypothetical protein
MTITARDRLQHAIHAWAEIRSPEHAVALNTEIEVLCIALDLAHTMSITLAQQVDQHTATIRQLQDQVRNTAAPQVVDALADLCTAYRAAVGLDGAWDQVVIRAEQVVIESRSAERAEL